MNRKEDQSKLDPALAAKLAAIGDSSRETEVIPGPSLITENTAFKVRLLLNMVSDPALRMQHQAENLPVNEAVYERAVSATENLLRQFPEGEGGFLHHMGEWMKAKEFHKFKDTDSLRDSATLGFGVVLLAYETQLGPEFSGRIREMTTQELAAGFENASVPYAKSNTILDRANNRKSVIPSHQAPLVALVDDFGRFVRYKYAMLDGASAAYNVIDNLWPQISGVPGRGVNAGLSLNEGRMKLLPPGRATLPRAQQQGHS